MARPYEIPRTVFGWEDFFGRPDVQRELDCIQACFSGRETLLSGSDERPAVVGDAEPSVIFPPAGDVFRALELTSLAAVRGVLLAQDPYHNGSPITGIGAATGLCFDVRPGFPVNPSLRNIYTELEAEGFVLTRRDGVLAHWAPQGLLMLNSALSVEQSNANSHAVFWKKFTDMLVAHVAGSPGAGNIQWILLGAEAQKMAASVTTGTKHCTSHPSPFAAHRGFLGSGVFRAAFGDNFRW